MRLKHQLESHTAKQESVKKKNKKEVACQITERTSGNDVILISLSCPLLYFSRKLP